MNCRESSNAGSLGGGVGNPAQDEMNEMGIKDCPDIQTAVLKDHGQPSAGIAAGTSQPEEVGASSKPAEAVVTQSAPLVY